MTHTLVIIANCSNVAKENVELQLFLEASEAITKAANDEEELLHEEKKEHSSSCMIDPLVHHTLRIANQIHTHLHANICVLAHLLVVHTHTTHLVLTCVLSLHSHAGINSG